MSENKTYELTVVDAPAAKPEQLKMQVQAIQQAMASVMRDGTHYGTIPGTDKPSLWKPGAEKICLMFRLLARFEFVREDLANGHREYTVTCTLTDLSGRVVAQGLGTCSTMESKYRYRKSYDEEVTEVAVPKEYWKTKDLGILRRSLEIAGITIGDKKVKPHKLDKGVWMIALASASAERAENPDIADCYNTVIKTAKKRAHVDATLTGTAASDIFTQDLEDFTTPSTPPKSAPRETVVEPEASADVQGDLGFPDQKPKKKQDSVSAVDKTKMIETFQSFSGSLAVGDFEQVLGKPQSEWGAAELNEMRKVYTKLTKGELQLQDVFPWLDDIPSDGDYAGSSTSA